MNAQTGRARLERLNASGVLQHLTGCGATESLRLAEFLTAGEYAELRAAGAELRRTPAVRQRVQEIRLAAILRQAQAELPNL